MSKKKNIKIEDLKQDPNSPVKQSYFESLEKSILKSTVQKEELKLKLKQELSVSQSGIQPLFGVPANYFTTLENAIASRTFDLEAEPEFVKIFESNFSKENVFEVPEGYFDWLPQRTEERKRAYAPEKNQSSWDWIVQKRMPALYAIAASVVLITGITLIVFRTNESIQFNTAGALQNISSNEVLAYMSSVDLDAEDIHLDKFDEIHLPDEVNLHKELENIDYQDIVDADEL